MQKWLDDNNILTYSTDNKNKSAVAGRFILIIRTWKTKTFKKMTANNKKSYLCYLNKLVDE